MRRNNKGFTLAELLIVIAIIAILIAIAIPVFGAQLRAARLSTDHANIRSAYAWAQSANLMGQADIDGDGNIAATEKLGATGTTFKENAVVNFYRDGTIAAAGSASVTGKSVYTLQVEAETDGSECQESPACGGGANHKQGTDLTITCLKNSSNNELVWTVLGTPTTPGP